MPRTWLRRRVACLRPWRAWAALLLFSTPVAGVLAVEATSLDDHPAPLAHPRSEQAADRLSALALYSAARLKEQKGEPAAALRQYERALRYGAEFGAVWPVVVGLAFDLERPDEAIRYALLAAERGPVEPALLRQLAVYLAQTGDRDTAIRYYERALEAAPADSGEALRLRFDLGRLYFLAGDSPRAADRLGPVFLALRDASDSRLTADDRRALLEPPAVVWRLFGEAFLADGRLEPAQTAFDAAQQAIPDQALHALAEAKLARARGDRAEARRQLDRCLASGSEAAGLEPYELLVAWSAADSEDAAAGLVELQRLHAAAPGNVPLSVALARQLVAAGDLQAARAVLEALAPERQPVEALSELAEIHRLQNDWSALVRQLGRALEKGESLASVSGVVRMLAADPAQLAALSAAADQSEAPLPRPARLALALVALEGRQFELAQRWFEAALVDSTKDQSADLLLGWGIGLLLADESARGVKVLERAVAQGFAEPAGSLLRFQLSGALSLAERYDEALAEARRAAALRSQSAEFAVRPPWVLYQAKRYAEAAAEFDKALARFDDKHEPASAREALRVARLTGSHANLLLGNLPAAEELLEQVLDEFPSDAGAQNDLAYLWADRGWHRERALTLAQAAVAQQPENAAYRDSLGWAFFQLGRFPESVVELEQAAAVDPPDGIVFDHLGDAYQGAGRTPDAQRAWRRSAELLDPADEGPRLEAVRRKLANAPH